MQNMFIKITVLFLFTLLSCGATYTNNAQTIGYDLSKPTLTLQPIMKKLTL